MIVKDPNKPENKNGAAFFALIGMLLFGYWVCNKPASHGSTINFEAIAEQAARAQVAYTATFKSLGYSDPHVVANRTCIIERYIYQDSRVGWKTVQQTFCMDSVGNVVGVFGQ